MKLVRFGNPGEERPGILLDNRLLDVRAMSFDIEDYDPHFFRTYGPERLRNLLNDPQPRWIPATEVRLGPPVANPGKIICVGVNFKDHAGECNHAVPDAPVLFSKPVSALAGPCDPVRIPFPDHVVDSEVELAVVIGKTACQVDRADAMRHIAGFTILNDVTDRTLQQSCSQWFQAKGIDTFCPLGPWLVTPDECPDPARLQLRSFHNDHPVQAGSLNQLMFNIPFLIEYISRSITLEPGDIISTGTPSGIASKHLPPLNLHAGDTIRLEIDGLGQQLSPVS